MSIKNSVNNTKAVEQAQPVQSAKTKADVLAEQAKQAQERQAAARKELETLKEKISVLEDTKELDGMNLAQIKHGLNEAVKAYNTALGKGNMKEVSSANAECKLWTDRYRACMYAIVKDALLAHQYPLKAACLLGEYQIERFADIEKDGNIQRVVKAAVMKVDLLTLHDDAERKLGADTEWNLSLQRFNLHMAAAEAKKFGIEEKTVLNDYAISHLAKDRKEFGKDPCTNKNLQKSMQLLIDKMIGEGYKATSHDLDFLRACYTKKNNRERCSVRLATHRELMDIFKDICYHLMTGANYKVDYRKIKKQR